jgi:plasmid maintenance system killer protein
MSRFADGRTEEVYNNGFAAGVPKHSAHAAHWNIHLLMAAHGWEDLAIFKKIATWPKNPGLYGLHIEGKWYVIFRWSKLARAFEVQLTRR